MKIIVIGSGYSGSGAVFDYLAGRPDVADPMQNSEFRLVQDPGGLIDLHHAISAFYFTRASAAIRGFGEFCDRLARPPRAFPPGIDYARRFPGFRERVARYLDAITAVEYDGISLHDVQRLDPVRLVRLFLRRKLARRRGARPGTGATMRLPVTEAVFLQESAALLDDLFHQTDGRPAAVNQGGSFWRPESSTQYYGDRRVIVVTRDVRDVFAEARTLSLAFPGGDVKAFAAWYSRMMAFVSADEWNSPVVMHIEFEQFVTQFARERARLDAFLGLDPAAPSSYDAERSRRNIGRFRDVLAPGEIAYLEAELPEHIRR